jgi:hypothetical protein
LQEWVYTAGLITFFVAAGLHVTVLLILGGIVGDDVPDAEH